MTWNYIYVSINRQSVQYFQKKKKTVSAVLSGLKDFRFQARFLDEDKNVAVIILNSVWVTSCLTLGNSRLAQKVAHTGLYFSFCQRQSCKFAVVKGFT